MQEKLSITEVYVRAGKYVVTHLPMFLLLTLFYFLGRLLPIFIGIFSYNIVILPYYYLCLYFAGVIYYKKKFSLNKDVFYAASLRLLMAVVMCWSVISFSDMIIGNLLRFVERSLFGGKFLVLLLSHNSIWLIFKYLFTYILIIVFFLIPSFAFVSEISGKTRSLLATYIKTKGNVIRIMIVVAGAYLLQLINLCILAILGFNPYVSEIPCAIVLAFITIIYFSLYDFFYRAPIKPQTLHTITEEVSAEEKTLSSRRKKCS